MHANFIGTDENNYIYGLFVYDEFHLKQNGAWRLGLMGFLNDAGGNN